jgi:hypothetical protein
LLRGRTTEVSRLRLVADCESWQRDLPVAFHHPEIQSIKTRYQQQLDQYRFQISKKGVKLVVSLLTNTQYCVPLEKCLRLIRN